MIGRLCAAVAFVAAAVAATTTLALAKPTFRVDGQWVGFFAGELGIVARGGARVAVRSGLTATGDAAYVDLVHDRIVIAGSAAARSGTRTVSGDALAFDLDTGSVDILNADGGAQRTSLDLHAPKAVPIDSDRFAFPDFDDRYVYIRGRHATVTSHANVRLAPAIFPNSPGALPVPSYLYTFDSNPSFGSSTLGAATFDQPYGLLGGPTSLLAAHFRYVEGVGATVALDQHYVYGDNAYVVASIDSPQNSSRTEALDIYQRMGRRFSQTLDAVTSEYGTSGTYALTGEFGHTSSRLSIAQSGHFGSTNLNLRLPDRPLIGGITYHLAGDFGYTAYPGGVISVLPDRSKYATVWQHDLEVYASTPIVKAPFHTSLFTTFDAKRTWYDFPHQIDQLTGTSTLSKSLFRNKLDLNLSYTAGYQYDMYHALQGLFFPPVDADFTAPDGTPWPGYAAYSGASETRGFTLDTSYQPNGLTSLHITVAQANDFPQFHGYGRPPWTVSLDARVRPLPNIGLDISRSYFFDWDGQRFSRWYLSILP